MGLINRDKDASEQHFSVQETLNAVPTGITLGIWSAPWPCTVQNVLVTTLGLSGAPTLIFTTGRFITGTGATTLTGVAGTYTHTAFGTSGTVGGLTQASAPYAIGISMQAVGSSLLSLQAGDAIILQTGGANSSVASMTVQIVVKATQDILSVQGQQT